MKNIFSYILLFLLPIISFGQGTLEDKIWKNHLRAIDNMGSTIDVYMVITYQNYHTKEINEVCLSSNDIFYIINDEYDLGYEPDDYSLRYEILTRAKDNFFVFKNERATQKLEKLILYTKEELDLFQKEIDIEKVVKELEQTKELNLDLLYHKDSRQKMMYIHSLFNKGFSVYQSFQFGLDLEN